MLFGSKLAVKTDGALFRYKVSWSRIVEMEQKKRFTFLNLQWPTQQNNTGLFPLTTIAVCGDLAGSADHPRQHGDSVTK